MQSTEYFRIAKCIVYMLETLVSLYVTYKEETCRRGYVTQVLVQTEHKKWADARE